MDRELKDLLTKGIDMIEPRLNCEKTVGVLEKLFDEITLFNPVYKLVAAEGKDLVIKHILDCLAPYRIIREEVKDGDVFADLGSGSGLPGIVLASSFPNEFNLVERMGRRAGFLRNTVTLTGLNSRVAVVEKDLSELDGQYDIITFRAFRQMKDIAGDLKRITKKGSKFFIYKSSEDNIAEDLSFVDSEIFSFKIKDYQVPFLDAQRSMLILETRF